MGRQLSRALFTVSLGLLGCGKDAPGRTDSSASETMTSAGVSSCDAPYPETFVADSVVLERTPCFGSCPAYRLRVSRSGAVHFRSRNFDDTTRTATAIIDSACVSELWHRFQWVNFSALPDTIASVPAYCENAFTDAQRVTVRLFAGTRTKHVVDYQGCVWAPAGLRELEERFDQIAGSSRWVRPNSMLPPPPA